MSSLRGQTNRKKEINTEEKSQTCSKKLAVVFIMHLCLSDLIKELRLADLVDVGGLDVRLCTVCDAVL